MGKQVQKDKSTKTLGFYCRKVAFKIIRTLQEVREGDSSQDDWTQELHSFKDVKIAIVKQSVYPDLYNCAPGLPAAATLLSSPMRTGIAAILSDLDWEFHMVHVDPAKECNVWLEKIYDQAHEFEYYDRIRYEGNTHRNGRFSPPQEKLAVSVDSIDWSKFDIVISFDVSIPERVTKLHPKVLWSYCLQEPSMRSYIFSHGKPIKGYDAFLNQRFRSDSVALNLKEHEIDFPYCIQRYRTFETIFPELEAQAEKKGVVVEHHAYQRATDAQKNELAEFGPVQSVPVDLFQHISGLHNAKYFAHWSGGRNLWGNAFIEAAACGAFLLADVSKLQNRALFSEKSAVADFPSLIARIKELEANQALFDKEIAEQRARLDYYCYKRPLNQLYKKWAAKQ